MSTNDIAAYLVMAAIPVLTINGRVKYDTTKQTQPEGEVREVGGNAEEVAGYSSEEHRLTNPDEIKEAIREEFAPLGEVAEAWGLRIAGCESTYRHWDSAGELLFNGSCCYGLFQFHPQTYVHYCDGDVWGSTARDQIRCAREMYEQGLQHHWECK